MNLIMLVFVSLALAISTTSYAEQSSQGENNTQIRIEIDQSSFIQVFSRFNELRSFSNASPTAAVEIADHKLLQNTNATAKNSQSNLSTLQSHVHKDPQNTAVPITGGSARETNLSKNELTAGSIDAKSFPVSQGYKGHATTSLIPAVIKPIVEESVVTLTPTLPPASDIWNVSKPWTTIIRWHPAGVISNVDGGRVHWADVNYVDINTMLLMSMIAYPALFLTVLYVMVITVSTCIGRRQQYYESELACARCYLPGVDMDVMGQAWSRQTSPCQEDATPRMNDGCMEQPDGADSTSGVISSSFGWVPPLPCGPGYAPPILARDNLNPFSQLVYSIWAYFCCTIPCIMVFGLPMMLTALSFSYPQEVFSILSLLTSALIFHNGVHMVVFATSSIIRINHAMRKEVPRSQRVPHPPPDFLQGIFPGSLEDQGMEAPMPSDDDLQTVQHWVIMPQYAEEFEVVSMALTSISQNRFARQTINVLLAMEEREAGCKQKAERLRSEFKDCFREICISFHPPNLPNDPPGKASNLKWAFDSLLEHLVNSRRDLSNHILTVCDADSEFHDMYFETLASNYLQVEPGIRNLRIWQSPIFHIKNYLRQPSPVIVGTMFTTMQELAMAGDPNAIRFPYSTYSLSLELVRRVGGWDPEWIAEDWHMGIKCYLLTVGNVSVEPIMLPTLNYTPEDNTWYKTCMARWAQAKRHALGFSDLSYYFMMLPLIFGHALARASRGRTSHLKAFWGMAMHGVLMLVRLVNVHVVIGVMASYGTLNFLLRFMMFSLMSEDRHIDFLWKRTSFCVHGLMMSSVMFMTIVTLQFQAVFKITKHRLDSAGQDTNKWSQWVIKHDCIHWIYTALCFIVFGTVYFFFLGICSWRAAWKMLTSPVFEYEVASKPKPMPPSTSEKIPSSDPKLKAPPDLNNED